MTILQRCILVLLVCLLWGCAQDPPPQDPPATGDTSQQPVQVQDQPTSPDQGEQSVAEPQGGENLETEDPVVPQEQLVSADATPPAEVPEQATQDPTDQIADAAAEPAPIEPTPKRVVLISSQAPLLVDFLFVKDHMAYGDRAAEAAMVLLFEADANNDGEPTWEEVAQFELISQQNTQMNLPRGRQRELLFRSYDRNANGLVEADELIQFYNRGTTGADWLTLQASAARNSNQSIGSGVGKWLDANRNNVLEADEIANAITRLQLRDVDDDGVLKAREFQQAMPVNPNLIPQANAIPAKEIPGFVISEDCDWSELLYRLTRGAPLLAEDVLAWSPAFHGLDADGDGTIWDDELAALADRTADITVHVQMPSLADMGALTAEITAPLEAFPYERKAETDQSVTLNCPVGDVTFSLAADYFDEAAENQLAAGFSQIDQNEDGELDEDEFNLLAMVLQISFEDADIDGDDRVTREELGDALAPSANVAALRVEMWLLGQNDNVMAALDQDGNQRLDEHELASVDTRLNELDANGDGMVQADEMDAGLTVVFRHPPTRGLPATAPAPIRNRAVRTDADDGPSWFHGMDANHDGRLSDREFLGTDEQFQSLDKDEDQVIELDEVDQ